MKVNFTLFGRVNKRYSRILFIIIIMLFIATILLSILAFKQPLVIEEKFLWSNLEEKTNFNFNAIVKPCTLYPNGGSITPDIAVFTSLTEDFIIKISSIFSSEKSVISEIDRKVTYFLIAERMWEKEYIVIEEKNIKTEGISHNFLDEEIHINLNEISSFIKKIEEETLVRPSYKILVKPVITGKVYDENKNLIYEINNQFEIPFSLTGQYLSYIGETEGREFVNTKSIERTNSKSQYFNFFGTRLDIIESRIGFGIASIILFLFILVYLLENKKSKKISYTETYLIDKKNKGKIVSISNKIDIDKNSYINLKSFKDLLKVAEEKDESIFKYEDKTLGIVYYYITSLSYIYLFKCVNTIKGSEEIQNA
jgi:hypothetical protein